MHKKIIVIGVIGVLLVVWLGGCTENSVPVGKDKFIGRWIGTSYDSSGNGDYEYELTFYENDTVKAEHYSYEGGQREIIFAEISTYTIQDTKICFKEENMTDENLTCYEYKFNNDYTTLTLTYIGEPEFELVLTKTND